MRHQIQETLENAPTTCKPSPTKSLQPLSKQNLRRPTCFCLVAYTILPRGQHEPKSCFAHTHTHTVLAPPTDSFTRGRPVASVRLGVPYVGVPDLEPCQLTCTNCGLQMQNLMRSAQECSEMQQCRQRKWNLMVSYHSACASLVALASSGLARKTTIPTGAGI
eukprot:1769-Amphidinium_carterae.1